MIGHIEEVQEQGFSVIQASLEKEIVDEMRRVALENLGYMSNTRLTRTSYHIAGFQRFPSLEPLHSIISSCGRVQSVLDDIYRGSQMIALGLTDITINRSQPWHTDLLRGKYSGSLTNEICWDSKSKPCLKVLVYLQDGASLQVIPGSHIIPIDLSDDAKVVPSNETPTHHVRMKAGDVVLMDIRLIHRGSTEAEMETKGLGDDAKILVSTVYGDRFSMLAQLMQIGNAQRLIDWDVRNRRADVN